RADGFSPYLVREGGLFKVRVGAFRDRERAEELAERLRARGYQVVIVR
ncbi:MAG: SPOR domain-containing protein, partial [Armatimonadetes bacterium]|nr:SPOR domain-containing protein [Armatimonadota bacterium]